MQVRSTGVWASADRLFTQPGSDWSLNYLLSDSPPAQTAADRRGGPSDCGCGRQAIPRLQRQDEIGTLVQAFKRMVSSLRQSIRRLPWPATRPSNHGTQCMLDQAEHHQLGRQRAKVNAEAHRDAGEKARSLVEVGRSVSPANEKVS